MTTLTLLSRVFLQVRPYWSHLGILFTLGLLGTPIALLLPLPLQIIVDSVVGQEPAPRFVTSILPGPVLSPSVLLGVAIGLLIVVNVLNLVQTLLSNVLREYAGEKIVLDFRSRLFEHVQRLSLAYHDSQGVAHSSYRIQWDAPALRWLTLDGIIPLISALFTFVSMIAVITIINVKVALVALVVAPVLVVLTKLYSPKLRNGWRQAQSHQSSAFGIIQEVLSALRVVNAFGQEQRERDRYLRKSLQGLTAQVRAAWMESLLNLATGLTIALGTAAVLLVGVKDIQAGHLTLGQMLLITAYASQLYGPLQTIGKQVAGQQQSFACLERAFELLDRAPAVTQHSAPRPITRAKGDIRFQNLSFSYDGTNHVLRGVSFNVPAGTRVGIVGATGAGKTTLLSLLIRFYEPTQGAICLDGHDLRDYSLADLRKQFAIVLQEPVLFSTTVADNIAYARPGASKAEIVAAAEAANAHQFISLLPDGYDTLVGERGMKLSGGERQRISLARAFLRDAPILVLDEPTSSVDVATEAVIVEAMHRLMHGRTCFVIAHRLNTLLDCDVFLNVEGASVKTEEKTRSDAADSMFTPA